MFYQYLSFYLLNLQFIDKLRGRGRKIEWEIVSDNPFGFSVNYNDSRIMLSTRTVQGGGGFRRDMRRVKVTDMFARTYENKRDG